MIPQNDMKVRRRKRGDWRGKSESGFYAVIHSLGAPLPSRMTRARMMESPFLRTKNFKSTIIVWIGKKELVLYDFTSLRIR